MAKDEPKGKKGMVVVIALGKPKKEEKEVKKAKKPDPRLKRVGVSGYNKPKRTPNHPKKSHVVVAKEGNKVKVIRYGQQGVSGSPKKRGESKSYRKRRESFKARHAKNIKRGKMSAAYWANRSKW